MANFSDRYGGYCTCTRDKCSDECTTYRRFKPKPITQGDCIRSMTDEELADIFRHLCCPYSLDGNPKYTENKVGGGCKGCWLDWLRQEAETK